MRRGILSVVAAAVTVVGLAGCVGPQPLPSLPPSPSSTPIFASEEEALAAAEDAYAAYLEMSNLISSEGGVNPERIAPFVTEEQLADEIEGSQYYQENAIRTDGWSKITTHVLQRYSEAGEAAEISFYVCVDVSAVAILNAAGEDVTPADRPSVIALEILARGDGEELLIADSNQWADSSFCL